MNQNPKNSDIICYYVGGLFTKEIINEKKYIINTIQNALDIPTTNIKYKTHSSIFAIQQISNQLINRTPLSSDNTFIHKIVYDILIDLENKQINKVFVLGHSYGGMIVNRAAEIIHAMCYGNNNTDNIDNIDMDNLPNKLTNKKKTNINILKKLSISTFGSIYFANDLNVKNLNIFNYISSSDQANHCNQLFKKPYLPFTLKIPYIGINCCDIQEKEKDPFIIQICLYKMDLNDNKPLCYKNKKNRIHKKNKVTNWDEHTHYTFFMSILLKNYDMNVYNLSSKNKNTFFKLEYKEKKTKPKTIKLKQNLNNKTKKTKTNTKSKY